MKRTTRIVATFLVILFLFATLPAASTAAGFSITSPADRSSYYKGDNLTISWSGSTNVRIKLKLLNGVPDPGNSNELGVDIFGENGINWSGSSITMNETTYSELKNLVAGRWLKIWVDGGSAGNATRYVEVKSRATVWDGYVKSMSLSPSTVTQGNSFTVSATIGGNFGHTDFYVKKSTASGTGYELAKQGITGSNPSANFSTSQLSPGTYYVYAVVYGNNAVLDNTQYKILTVTPATPKNLGEPKITTPARDNDTVFVDKDVTFKWQTDSNATSYRLRIRDLDHVCASGNGGASCDTYRKNDSSTDEKCEHQIVFDRSSLKSGQYTFTATELSKFVVGHRFRAGIEASANGYDSRWSTRLFYAARSETNEPMITSLKVDKSSATVGSTFTFTYAVNGETSRVDVFEKRGGKEYSLGGLSAAESTYKNNSFTEGTSEVIFKPVGKDGKVYETGKRSVTITITAVGGNEPPPPPDPNTPYITSTEKISGTRYANYAEGIVAYSKNDLTDRIGTLPKGSSFTVTDKYFWSDGKVSVRAINVTVGGKAYAEVFFDANRMGTSAPPTDTPTPIGDPPPTAGSSEPIWPTEGGEITQGDTSAHSTSTFVDPDTGKRVLGHAIDIAVPIGTNVYATKSGTIYRVQDLGNKSFGKYIYLKHDDGTWSAYCHLSSFLVSEGQYVTQGKTIAKSGNSGDSTGPHLHFEITDGKFPTRGSVNTGTTTQVPKATLTSHQDGQTVPYANLTLTGKYENGVDEVTFDLNLFSNPSGVGQTITRQNVAGGNGTWSITIDKSKLKPGEKYRAGVRTTRINPPSETWLEFTFTVAGTQSVPVTGTYDPWKAVAYARKWSSESTSENYEEKTNTEEYGSRLGADCANFVSQCLEAGGLPRDNTTTFVSKYDVGKEATNIGWKPGTLSWNNNITLFDYLKLLGYQTRDTMIGDPLDWRELQPGDLVFWERTGDKDYYDHVIIITENIDGNPLFCAHTADHKDYELKAIGEFRNLRAVFMSRGNGSQQSVSNPPTTITVPTQSVDALKKLATAPTVANSDRRETMLRVANNLVQANFDIAFVVGVLANIYHEGNTGWFEGTSKDSMIYNAKKGIREPEPRWKYLNETFNYYEKYSYKYIYNGFSLSEVDNMVKKMKKDGFKSLFGLGSAQWTYYTRLERLMTLYIIEANGKDTITKKEALSVECKLWVEELKGSENEVYQKWLRECKTKGTAEATVKAAEDVCRNYERPSNMEEQITIRKQTAQQIFQEAFFAGNPPPSSGSAVPPSQPPQPQPNPPPQPTPPGQGGSNSLPRIVDLPDSGAYEITEGETLNLKWGGFWGFGQKSPTAVFDSLCETRVVNYRIVNVNAKDHWLGSDHQRKTTADKFSFADYGNLPTKDLAAGTYIIYFYARYNNTNDSEQKQVTLTVKKNPSYKDRETKGLRWVGLGSDPVKVYSDRDFKNQVAVLRAGTPVNVICTYTYGGKKIAQVGGCKDPKTGYWLNQLYLDPKPLTDVAPVAPDIIYGDKNNPHIASDVAKSWAWGMKEDGVRVYAAEHGSYKDSSTKYDAIFLVYENKKLVAVFTECSTLPDVPKAYYNDSHDERNLSPAILQDGEYRFHHETDHYTGKSGTDHGYAWHINTKNDEQELPALRWNRKDAFVSSKCKEILIHKGSTKMTTTADTKGHWSVGCLMINGGTRNFYEVIQGNDGVINIVRDIPAK